MAPKRVKLEDNVAVLLKCKIEDGDREVKTPKSDTELDEDAAETLATEPNVPVQSPSSASQPKSCLLYTSPSPRDLKLSRMPSSA